MASANEYLYDGYDGSTYFMEHNPDDFATWYSIKYNKGVQTNPYSFWNKLGNFFSGNVTNAEKAYDQYVNDWYDERNQERAAFANWQTQQREDSAIQRAKADYEKAGFSPYALITSNYSSPSSAVNYATRKGQDYDEKNKESDKMVSTALKIMALLILKKAL